jgi:uncharacterized protein involved in outer membrane biogenesis
MSNPHPIRAARLAAIRATVWRWSRSRRARRNTRVVALALTIYGLLGFFAAPPVIRSQLQTRLTALLERPVRMQAVHLNPFTLRLELDGLHVADRDRRSPFVDVDRVVVNASWSSLFRLAPVLDELALQHPQLHLARTAPQRFNCSDLVDKFAGGPPKPDSKPARFALSNISVHDGEIVFDDAVAGATHRIDHLELGIPFLANLPRDSDVFVQPLLAMNLDGSPLRIVGRAKPFADNRESAVDITLDHLDLPRYLGYVPVKLPVAIPRSQLSGQLRLRFVQAASGPQLRLGGQLRLDDTALTTPAGAPLLELGHASAALDDVEPLLARYRLGAVQLDGLAVHYNRAADGHGPLGGGGGTTAAAAPPLDLAIASLALRDSRLAYADASGGGPPATLTLEHIHGTLHGFSTLAAPPATLDVAATLDGGSLATNGKLDAAGGRYDGTLALRDIGLPPLQPLAPPLLDAALAKGSLSATGRVQTDWRQVFNLTLSSASATIADLALTQGRRTPLAWRTLQAGITRFDLASRTAQLDQVSLRGLRVDARRLPAGGYDLAGLVRPAPSRDRHPPSPDWHWGIARVELEGTLALTDPRIAGPHGRAEFTLTRAAVNGLSDDPHRPLALTLDGGSGRGRLQLEGTLRPVPLDAGLHVRSSRLDIAPLQALIDVPLNVRLASALLSADGRLRYRDHRPQALVDWRGHATLGNVRVQDKLSGDDFLRWDSLDASGMEVHLGEDVPHVAVAALALDDFYARLILNASGRLNVRDVVASPSTAPVSVTRTRRAPAAAKAPAEAAAPLDGAAAPAADIRIGGITLAGGHLNYTDNFIKPNYTANITQLAGKVGAFGSAGRTPAELNLQGQLDDDTPVAITGTIDPLAPQPSLDVQGKAEGVELTHLSPYAGKYTGYPITHGRLNADVHYRLGEGKLQADNHLFITQLTFGDAIQGSGIRHLPVKLAVALLKDANGNIDVRVPVSGSLNDPQFSVGSLVWHAFANLIGHAITSPFRLIAAAVGGGKQQDLGHVAFAPGSAVLDAKAQDKLAQIVKILQQKTSLKLEITGRIDPKFDDSGLRKVMVDDLVQQEAGADPATLTPAQYDKYLKKAYKHAKFPKPRDFVGLAKSQPPDVMRKLLETHMPVNADALHHLAERRADAVHAWLHGKLDDGRVFVLAPKLDATGIDDQGKTTRAEFGLR